MRIYEDRHEAGECLGSALKAYSDRDDVLVLALPRGGVPVAFEVARALDAPLDVFMVRKLGSPGQSELAMGAIASGGIRVMNDEIVRMLGLSDDAIARVMRREQQEIERREASYRKDLPPLEAKGKTVILVDDGVATGATMRAAVLAARQLEPARLIVAVPTAAREACELLEGEADELLSLETPEPYVAVGYWYRYFPQVGDEEVRSLLHSRSKELERASQDSEPVQCYSPKRRTT